MLHFTSSNNIYDVATPRDQQHHPTPEERVEDPTDSRSLVVAALKVGPRAYRGKCPWVSLNLVTKNPALGQLVVEGLHPFIGQRRPPVLWNRGDPFNSSLGET